MARSHPHAFLKWAGGKQRLVGTIVNRLPVSTNVYHERMIGGGSTFFELFRLKRFKHAVIGDKNPELVNTYRTIQNDVDSLIEELHLPEFKNDKESFLHIRTQIREQMSSLNCVQRAARMIYLNRTCFNGLFRVSPKFGFNVPFGKYSKPVICDVANLKACAEALKMADIVECDFDSGWDDAGPGDSAYFDPPYIPLSMTANFTGYTKDGFSLADHKRLARLFDRLAIVGVSAVLSNSHTPLSLELYGPHDLRLVNGYNCIGGPAEFRGEIKEIMVSTRSLFKPPSLSAVSEATNQTPA